MPKISGYSQLEAKLEPYLNVIMNNSSKGTFKPNLYDPKLVNLTQRSLLASDCDSEQTKTNASDEDGMSRFFHSSNLARNRFQINFTFAFNSFRVERVRRNGKRIGRVFGRS
jgi:hypothetical protein